MTDAMIRTISSRVVYANPWMTVREDEIERPDGSPGLYGYVDKPDFVLVIPMERDGFHLVQEFRYPIGRRSWSFPQGAAVARDREEEARIELAEETGLTAVSLEPIGRLDNAHGTTNQGFHVYLATGLTPGPARREASEQDMIQTWVPRAELERMIDDGRVGDSCTVAAYALLLLRERTGK
ncbi:NUDIX hydrolase [Acrocarpospora macrocephala]|uniref:ADP-ribose pyrophosphatase n=1 Tax=Acrocarpospora macrocephala TaxID=150177 RepID=A0A5M3X3J7_9ACTN|nr:NUDIX hydrolase [Acrocarpospora macrocephala]GES16327.1 ADP-ribose pyrophosphatase [Acrocarpospora macrocephala]